jgi:hypothetical protein
LRDAVQEAGSDAAATLHEHTGAKRTAQ